MLNKETIMTRAIEDCMRELYAKAQPSADYDELVEKYRSGEIGKDERVYERYYLSEPELRYIVDKYKTAFRLNDRWNEYVEVVENYLSKGGLKDGHDKEGHRIAKKVPPLSELIKKKLNSELKNNVEANSPLIDKLSKSITNIVLKDIADCKGFYRFGRRDEDTFDVNIFLGASPTCNKKTVIEYWKTQGVDVKIEDRNPDLLWDMDYYGDEFEEVMEEEYGKNWEKKTWDRYNKRVEKEKKEAEKRLQKFLKKHNKDNG